MGKEEIERNQRSRLYGAMIESVAQRGYEATTISHLLGLAGVGRRRFYTLFANKEECFLGTYDIVVAHTRKRMLEAWQSERGWVNRLHASCKVLLDDAADSPKGPHLVLVDTLGIGPKARERMLLAGFTFERLVSAALVRAPDSVVFPSLTSRAVVSGVRHLLFTHILEERHEELHGLTDEVLDWIGSYRIPPGKRLRTLKPDESQRVSPMPAAFLTREDPRARALGSLVHLTLDEGYATLTDPQIADFAGISTKAFHKQFANKEECFLAVLDEFTNEALDVVRPVMESAVSWEEGVYLSIGAFLEHLVTHQALLRLTFIDLFEVGPGMIRRMTGLVADLVDLLTRHAPDAVSAPQLAQPAVTGALWGIISTYVGNDRLSRIPTLIDHLAFIVLAPYIGAESAIEAVAAVQRRQS